MASDKPKKSWYFLFIVIGIFIIISIININQSKQIISFFLSLLEKMILIFIIIFILMFLTNLLISKKILIKHLGHDSGIKGWFFAVIGGILSSGPIYMWYPLLADLKNKGMRISLIATFIYNRAIKIPLIPLMIIYFNWTFMITLTIVMITISIINGVIVEKILNKSSKKSKGGKIKNQTL